LSRLNTTWLSRLSMHTFKLRLIVNWAHTHTNVYTYKLQNFSHANILIVFQRSFGELC
jgi:hypothetical protein